MKPDIEELRKKYMRIPPKNDIRGHSPYELV